MSIISLWWTLGSQCSLFGAVLPSPCMGTAIYSSSQVPFGSGNGHIPLHGMGWRMIALLMPKCMFTTKSSIIPWTRAVSAPVLSKSSLNVFLSRTTTMCAVYIAGVP